MNLRRLRRISNKTKAGDLRLVGSQTKCKSLVLITAAAVWWLAGLYLYLSPKLPEAEALTDIKLQTPLRIMSSDGQLIGQFGEQKEYRHAMRICLRALLVHCLLRKTTASLNTRESISWDWRVQCRS